MNYSDIHGAVLKWYDRFGRHDLPWRRTNDPYKIYISEIMLQQTQVKTVLERFYFPFLERFPTLQSVADAPLEEVLHAWQGLGYYRRARYIHRTARLCAPNLPTDPNELVKLPGIGQSTAHAIAVFSTGAPYPVLEANVRRILFRFFAQKTATPKALWQMAWALLDRTHPYEYNQALMDIGAAVCTPQNPDCTACPLQSRCRGQNDPLAFPAAKSKKERPVKTTHYLLIEKGRHLLMRRRQGEMLAGLWELPSTEQEPSRGEKLFEIVHDYTHFRRIAIVWRCDEEVEGEWIDADRLHEIPVSSLERKIFARLFETNAH